MSTQHSNTTTENAPWTPRTRSTIYIEIPGHVDVTKLYLHPQRNAATRVDTRIEYKRNSLFCNDKIKTLIKKDIAPTEIFKVIDCEYNGKSTSISATFSFSHYDACIWRTKYGGYSLQFCGSNFTVFSPLIKVAVNNLARSGIYKIKEEDFAWKPVNFSLDSLIAPNQLSIADVKENKIKITNVTIDPPSAPVNTAVTLHLTVENMRSDLANIFDTNNFDIKFGTHYLIPIHTRTSISTVHLVIFPTDEHQSDSPVKISIENKFMDIDCDLEFTYVK
jgi:hypothetical protein